MQKLPFLCFFAVGIALFWLANTASSCKKQVEPNPVVIDTTTQVQPKSDMVLWLTAADRSTLFKQQNRTLAFADITNASPVIEVDTTQRFQTMDGFGMTLTGGSAYLMQQKMNATQRAALLQELFRADSTYIGVSFLRVSIGASDLSATPFTYDDSPSPDPDLTKFSLEKDKTELIPVLQQILAIRPDLKILGSPWSAPTWMKTNNSFVGGSLLPAYYDAYARYLVRYVQAMQQEGIPIAAITIQNEPENPNNNPSMTMTAAEQADFVKNHLGPAFQAASLSTKIIVFDHNCDHPEYPISILNDPAAKAFIDGSAFHLYAGNIDALSQVHQAHPDRNVYFTEQYVGANGNFGGDLGWHTKNLIVGASRNWAKAVLEWNLAADTNLGPHTIGGCTTCLGALTIDNAGNVTRNTPYYIVAQAAKWVRPGSVRVASNEVANLPNVAFQAPNGKKVLIVLNESGSSQNFNIRYKGKGVHTSLAAGAVGTFVW